MHSTTASALAATLARVAPGTALREGLDRILRGRTGALIVLGHDDTVESICSGGFDIDIDFTPPRLRELAKMDGGIVVNHDATSILKASVQLVPDSAIPTEESGTRHRTAQRVAAQTGLPVITVSASMQMIAIFVGQTRHQLEDTESILARATQALTTLTRYRLRLDQVTAELSKREIEDTVSVRDVASVVQRQEMLRRISDEIAQYVLELGTDGRLIELQLQELTGTRDPEVGTVIEDYARAAVKSGHAEHGVESSAALNQLSTLSSTDLVDLSSVAHVLGFNASQEALDLPVQPLGLRLLSGVESLSRTVRETITDRFGGLQNLMAATVDDLTITPGVDVDAARTVREGLSRFAEATLVNRYR
ncbi:MAG: DNA integrity scanning diadenylate cyclase DisA [Galactobacter sp.]